MPNTPSICAEIPARKIIGTQNLMRQLQVQQLAGCFHALIALFGLIDIVDLPTAESPYICTTGSRLLML